MVFRRLLRFYSFLSNQYVIRIFLKLYSVSIFGIAPHNRIIVFSKTILTNTVKPCREVALNFQSLMQLSCLPLYSIFGKKSFLAAEFSAVKSVRYARRYSHHFCGQREGLHQIPTWILRMRYITFRYPPAMSCYRVSRATVSLPPSDCHKIIPHF